MFSLLQLFGVQRKKKNSSRKKKARWEAAKEHLWATLTEGPSAYL